MLPSLVLPVESSSVFSLFPLSGVPHPYFLSISLVSVVASGHVLQSSDSELGSTNKREHYTGDFFDVLVTSLDYVLKFQLFTCKCHDSFFFLYEYCLETVSSIHGKDILHP